MPPFALVRRTHGGVAQCTRRVSACLANELVSLVVCSRDFARVDIRHFSLQFVHVGIRQFGHAHLLPSGMARSRHLRSCVALMAALHTAHAGLTLSLFEGVRSSSDACLFFFAAVAACG